MKAAIVAIMAVAVMGGIWMFTETAESAFHLMRVYGVMGGAEGNADVRYVELRMTDPGQSLVNGHHICFFDGNGNPWARFRFSGNVLNGGDESSILMGTAEFDTAWPAGSPDFVFSSANTVAIDAAADPDHPLVSPAGQVAFGTDGAATVPQMCQGSFAVIDSVAYGSGFSGTANYPPAFGSDLPASGAQTLQLQGLICHPDSFGSPCPQPRDNSVDYAIVSGNASGNNPRNNAGDFGPVGFDADGDGFSNVNEGGEPLCLGSANNDAADDAVANDGCPAIGAAEVDCADTVDDDSDTFVNDGCPQVGTFSEGALNIGTGPNVPCGSAGWPADIISTGASTNKVTLQDLTSFIFPAPSKLNTSPGDAGWDQRYDLVTNGTVALNDLTSLLFGPAATPPMLGGAAAFNGPECPLP